VTFNKQAGLQTRQGTFINYNEKHQQGMAAFNESNTQTAQQQEPQTMSPGRPKQKHDRAQGRAQTILSQKLYIRRNKSNRHGNQRKQIND
jgi:hypothetical protein